MNFVLLALLFLGIGFPVAQATHEPKYTAQLKRGDGPSCEIDHGWALRSWAGVMSGRVINLVAAEHEREAAHHLVFQLETQQTSPGSCIITVELKVTAPSGDLVWEYALTNESSTSVIRRTPAGFPRPQVLTASSSETSGMMQILTQWMAGGFKPDN